MKNAYQEYKNDLKELVSAYKGIMLSDAFINILNRKINKAAIAELKLDQMLSGIVKIYPDKYIQELFVVKLITLLEEFLKNKLVQEFYESENSVKKFLLGYVTDRKLTTKDVIDGPQKLALSLLDEILYHNLPKVEKLYFITFDLDIKKLCDFKQLVLMTKIRHLIVHNGTKDKAGKKVKIFSVQTFLNEINRLIENIEFATKNGRPKKVIKSVDIEGFGKAIYNQNMQDILDYKVLKVLE